jgi:hypothetical protein
VHRAEYLVERLIGPVLEAAAFGGKFARMLLKPTRWTNFWSRDAHGVLRYSQRVEAKDQDAFCANLKKLGNYLAMNDVLMPDGKWCLKMPMSYGILGEGVVGNSVLGKTQVVPVDCVPVDNPLMGAHELRMWRTGL